MELRITQDVIDIIRNLTMFAPRFLVVATKGASNDSDGSAPLTLNKAQLYIHRRLEDQLKATGTVRALILKGRQQGCCWSKNMQVLTADYRWIKITDVKIGDSLVACDEESPGKTVKGRKQSRKFRTTIVEDKREFIKECFEIILDNGARLEVTGDHRMLCKKRGGDEQQWREINDLIVGDVIRIATRPPNYDCQTHEDGWIAGIIDGEGSQRGGKGAKRLSIHQTQGKILDRIKAYFNKINIPYCEVIDRRTKCGQRNKLGDKPVHRLDIHRLPYLIELFARCRPTRFTNDEWHVGHELPGKAAQDGSRPWAQVISIKSLGKMQVIDLQTDTKTYICEGLVSHNSTYVQARYFHKIITTQGKKAFILAHEADATDNLFKMTRRYYENLPEGLCPKPEKLNTSEMEFSQFKSSYRVGTAGNKKTGRSQTIHLFHGSEVGFWENTSDLATGALQAVSGSPGTEIILESTANGLGNFFHKAWCDAIKGDSEYQAIFVPWYWQDEYTKTIPGFNCNQEEFELLELYKANGLTEAHLAWRRTKMRELDKDPDRALELFKQEYPFTAEEAFLNPIANVFIKAKYVVKARAGKVDTDAKLIIGVDPSGDKDGADRTAIIRRRGRRTYKLETFRGRNLMEICGIIVRIIKEEKPDKIYIDCIGIGKGLVDRLRELGYEFVEGINVANSAHDKDQYLNRRSELWDEARQYLAQDLPVELPDSDELQSDLCSVGFTHNSNGQLIIESKQSLRKRGMPSCDTADAFIHTFAGGFYEATIAAPSPIVAPRKGMFV